MLRALTTRFQYVLLLILVRTSKDPVRLVFCSTNVFFKRGIALGLSSECQSILLCVRIIACLCVNIVTIKV